MFTDTVAGQSDDKQDDEQSQVTKQKRKLRDRSKLRKPFRYDKESML